MGFCWAFKRPRRGSVTSPYSSVGKESACNAEGPVSIPGSGRSPGEGHGNPLQCACLENPMERGAWRATVHGVARVRHDLAARPPQERILHWVMRVGWLIWLDEGQGQAWLKPSEVSSFQVSTLPSDPAPPRGSLDAHPALGSWLSESREMSDRQGSSRWLTGRRRSAFSLHPPCRRPRN